MSSLVPCGVFKSISKRSVPFVFKVCVHDKKQNTTFILPNSTEIYTTISMSNINSGCIITILSLLKYKENKNIKIIIYNSKAI